MTTYSTLPCRVIEQCDDGKLMIVIAGIILFVEPSWVRRVRR